MSAFNLDKNTFNRLDWKILRDSPIASFDQKSYLGSALLWFRNNNYEIHTFNCKEWNNENDFYKDVGEKLNFSSYWTRNLDALNDCLSEIKIP